VISKTKKISVTASPKKVEASRTVTVKVSGLAPYERVTVSYDGHRISKLYATASSTGKITVTTSAGYAWGKKTVRVVGSLGGRKGSTSVTVGARH
jgi:hypothetical protein